MVGKDKPFKQRIKWRGGNCVIITPLGNFIIKPQNFRHSPYIEVTRRYNSASGKGKRIERQLRELGWENHTEGPWYTPIHTWRYKFPYADTVTETELTAATREAERRAALEREYWDSDSGKLVDNNQFYEITETFHPQSRIARAMKESRLKSGYEIVSCEKMGDGPRLVRVYRKPNREYCSSALPTRTADGLGVELIETFHPESEAAIRLREKREKLGWKIVSCEDAADNDLKIRVYRKDFRRPAAKTPTRP